MNIKEKLTGLRMKAGIIGASIVGALCAMPAHAADYTASTTAAIEDGVGAFLNPFFDNIGLVLGGVAAVVITLWGIRWVMSHFKGGRR